VRGDVIMCDEFGGWSGMRMILGCGMKRRKVDLGRRATGLRNACMRIMRRGMSLDWDILGCWGGEWEGGGQKRSTKSGVFDGLVGGRDLVYRFIFLVYIRFYYLPAYASEMIRGFRLRLRCRSRCVVV
jgi:hypothetical protein